MRIARPAWIALVGLLLATSGALASSVNPGFSHPSRGDLILSQSGVATVPLAQTVVAIAGFDYDLDGDLDLFIGTLHDAVVWLNDGRGAYSALPLRSGVIEPPALPQRIEAATTATSELFDRDDSCVAEPCALVSVMRNAAGGVTAAALPPALSGRSTSSSPRAPPR